MSIPSQKVSSSNKLIYQRLKQAIDLNLRRQIFIAACDDLCLRDCLAARLQTELARESAASDPRSPHRLPPICQFGTRLERSKSLGLDRRVADPTSTAPKQRQLQPFAGIPNSRGRTPDQALSSRAVVVPELFEGHRSTPANVRVYSVAVGVAPLAEYDRALGPGILALANRSI
jgi:hypothetical protein